MKDINFIEPVSLATQKSTLIKNPVFIGAVISYTSIMAVGFLLDPIYALVGLFLIALISIFKILFKNFLLISGMILLGLACIALPFLLIIYIPLLIVFFIARLAYFIEHWNVVLVGLAIYFLPVAILIKGMTSQPFLIFLIIPTILFPIAIHYFYKNYDYTVENILELFSEAPILIISIILPFLKIGFTVGDTPVAINNNAIPEGHAVNTEVLATKPISSITTTTVNNLPGSTELVALDPAPPVIMPNYINPNFNVDSFYQSLSQSHSLFSQTGNESIIPFGDKVQIGLGSDHITLVKDGFHINIIDSDGSQVGTIEDNQGVLEIKDTYGLKMGEIGLSQQQNTILFKDSHNITVASIDKSIQSDLSKNFLQAEIDKTQDVLEHLEKEPVSADQVEYTNKVAVTMLSILAAHKVKKNTDSDQIIVKDISKTTSVSDLKDNSDVSKVLKGRLKPLHSITFAKYIDEHCSKKFRDHKKIYFPDRFDKIDNKHWRSIRAKYKVLKVDVAFIISSNVGSTGLLITNNDVIYVRDVWSEPVSYYISQIAGIKKAEFLSETELDSNNIFIVDGDITGMKPIFKELHELFVKYWNIN